MFKRFLSDSLIYAFPNVFSRIIGFFLLIFYTRFLSPSDYGIIELILVLYSLLNLILPLEITQGVARFYGDANEKQRSIIISTSFVFTLLVFFIPICLSLLFPSKVSSFLFSGILEPYFLTIVFLFMFFHSLHKLFENQLRWSLQPYKFSYLSVFSALSFSLIPIFFIYFLNLGLDGYIYGVLLASFFSFLIGFYLVNNLHKIKLSLDRTHLNQLLSFSSPLVLSSAAFYVFSYSDRWMLQFMESTEAVGIYGAASRLASLAAVIHVLSRYAFMPLVYSSYNESESAKDIGKIFSFISLLGIFLLTFIFIYANDLVTLLFGESFYEASNLIVFLAASIIFMNTYFFFPGLNIAKKTKLIAVISISVALINLFGNYLLIPLYSMKGAAISSLFASSIMVFAYYYFGQREYRVNLNISKVILFSTVSVILSLIQKFLLWDYMISKIFIIFVSFLFLIFFSKDYLLTIKSVILSKN